MARRDTAGPWYAPSASRATTERRPSPRRQGGAVDRRGRSTDENDLPLTLPTPRRACSIRCATRGRARSGVPHLVHSLRARLGVEAHPSFGVLGILDRPGQAFDERKRGVLVLQV